jgi:hypothetical protein
LYSRFGTNLKDKGFAPTEEPFKNWSIKEWFWERVFVYRVIGVTVIQIYLTKVNCLIYSF